MWCVDCNNHFPKKCNLDDFLMWLTSFFRELTSLSKLSTFLSYWLIRPCSPSSSSDVRSVNRNAEWECSGSTSGSGGVISRWCVGPLVQITFSVTLHEFFHNGLRGNFPLRCVTSHLYEASRMEAFPGGIHGTRALTMAVGRRFPLSTLVFPFKTQVCNKMSFLSARPPYAAQ